MLFFLFILEFVLLFFLSRQLTRSLSYALYKSTRNRKIAIYSLALLFFPGTLIHELAHYFTAAVLFVPVGRMEFFPQLIEGGVKLGSVQIAKSDPFRHAAIGVAPVLVGLAVLLLSFFYLAPTEQEVVWWKILLLAYISFEVGNTLFSSKKDMEGTLELLLTLGIVALVLFLLGVRIPTDFFLNSTLQKILYWIDIVLGFVLVLDGGVVIVVRFVT